MVTGEWNLDDAFGFGQVTSPLEKLEIAPSHPAEASGHRLDGGEFAARAPGTAAEMWFDQGPK